MKRILLLMILSCMAITGFAQTTYYWVGGTAEGNINTANKWNTKLDGTGVTRSAITTTDVLVIDGSNIGGAVVTQGTALIHLNTTTTAQVKLINAASVILVRVASSNGILNISNNTVGEAGLTIDATSTLQLNNIGYIGNIYIDFPTSTASVSGKIKLTQGGSTVANASPRLTARATGALVFLNGSSFEYDNTLNYPFGTVGTGTSNSSNGAVVFQSGASLIYKSSFNPFGSNSTAAIVTFQSGSNLILEAANAGNMFNGKTLANVLIRNNTTVTLGENFSSIENLTIETGSSFYLRGSSTSPFKGNIINNGTFGVAAPITSSQLVMVGTSPQSIGGTGVFADLGAISIGAESVVTVNKSLNFVGVSSTTNATPTTSSISGTLNLMNNVLNGTGRFTFRPRMTVTNANASIVSGSNIITFANATEFGDFNVALGVTIQGDNIPANSYIVSTNSDDLQFTISNAATGNGGAITSVVKSHLITSNVGGVDGSVLVSGTKSFGAGLYYTFNAATATPFSISSGNALGDVIFNAAATTNRNATINGKLTLNNAILTVREGDNLSLSNASINTGTFNASSYIVTNAVGGSTGVLKIADVSASTLVPVGTSGHYTPVTLNPTSISNFEINVFQGATADATSNGTALTPAQKLRMVDAVWNINRTSGTGNVDVTLGWDNALEGTSFAGFGNAQIGVAAYTSGAYGTFTGTGNAAANTATITTSTFSPFVVGEANTTLPLRLLSFTAKESLNSVKLAWQTTDEVNLKEYVLQHRSTNGFEKIYSVAANNKAGIFNYDYTHLNPTEGVNYYRLVGVDQDGTEHPSEVKSVRMALDNGVAVYPNPVRQNNISVAGTVNGDVIKIINIQGQVMLTKPVSGNQLQEINVQHIQAGTYILSIENAGKVTSTKKVIKI